MNNYAISSDGIATALQDSASALMSAGNNLEQATALVAAANKVVQDPNSVGSALRTISLRLRGTSVEILEGMGEETDGVVESISKLQEKIKALSGVDILTNAGDYKDTYTILKEIGSVWKDMSDVDQAALLELMAGKNRANTLSAILGNMRDLEGAYESALNAEGSALKENDTYLNSIQGRIDKFNNAVQTMWKNLLDSEFIKDIVDMGTALIKFLDSGMGKITALSAALMLANAKIFKFTPALKVVNGQFQIFGKTADQISSNFSRLSEQSGGFFNKLKAGFTSVTSSSDFGKIDLSKMMPEEDFNAKLNGMIAGFNGMKDAGSEIPWDQFVAGVSQTDAAMGAALKTCQAQNGAIVAGEGAYKAYAGATTAAAVGTSTVGKSANVTTAGLWGMRAAALAANIALTMGLSLIISLATEAISSWINAGKKAEESAKKARESAIESAKAVEEQNKSLEDYKEEITDLRKELDSNTLSEQEAYDAREKLLSIQNDLIEKFGLEAGSINLVTGAIEDQIVAIDELSKKNAQEWINTNGKAITKAIKYFDDNNVDLDKEYTNNIINKHPTKNVFEAVRKYAATHDNIIAHTDVGVGTSGTSSWDEYVDNHKNKPPEQAITFQGSAEEIKKASEEFLAWIIEYRKTTQAQISALEAIPVEQRTDKQKKQLKSLKKDLVQIEDMWKDMGAEYKNWFGEGSKYQQNKEILENLQQNTALTTYANEYAEILQAQQDYEEALLSGDEDAQREALERINSLTDAATVKAKQDGNNYMTSFWDGIQEGYKKESDANKLELDISKNVVIEDSSGLGGGLGDLLNLIIRDLDGLNAKEILQLEDIGFAGDWAKYETPWRALSVIAQKYGFELEYLVELLVKLGYIQAGFASDAETAEKTANSYSTIASAIEGIAEAQQHASEAIHDGIALSADAAEALQNQLAGVAVEEGKFSDAVDTQNGNIVKNAALLKKLIEQSKKEQQANIRTAKSQAQLEYYNLYKQIRTLTNGEVGLAKANVVQINTLYEQMSAIQKTIAKYSMLEAKLLGVSDAFDKFEEAQSIDSETDYISTASEMVSEIANAFNTGKLGTEAAQAAIKGMVPEDIYINFKTNDEKMDAVYKYFTEGALSKYFSIEFDDEGTITNVESTIEDVEQFINDGLTNLKLENGETIFQGTLDEFVLNPTITSMEQLEKATGLTGTALFALFDMLEDYDTGWIGGNNETLMDQLMGDDLEYGVYKTTQELAKLEVQLANGAISAEDYGKAFDKLSAKEAELAERAKSDTEAYYTKNEELTKLTDQLKTYQLQLKTGKDANGNLIDAEQVAKNIAEVQSKINTLTGELSKLEKPTEVVLQFALDAFEKDMSAAKSELAKLGINVDDHVQFDEKQKKYILVGLEDVTDEDTKKKIQEYANMANTKYTIETNLGKDTPAVAEQLETIAGLLKELSSLLQTGFGLTINADGQVEKINDVKTGLEGLPTQTTSKVTIVTEYADQGNGYSGFKLLPRHSQYGAIRADGTAHANGTAHQSGDWGLPTNEHDALVGELGPELVVDPHSGRYYTVGNNGAEMVDLPKNAIVFNHIQTRGLLENGHIASRGKAYANGTAHAGIDTYFGKQNRVYKDWTGSLTPDSSTVKEIDEKLSGAADEFSEIIDWIEIRMEELDETISKLNAEIENEIYYTNKNNKIDEIIAKNREKYANAKAGAAYYENYAQKFYNDIPEEYRDAAKNGTIAITDFAGDANEAVVEAINKYREYAQKATDLTQQSIETITEIRDLAIQRIDNAKEHADVRTNVESLQTEKLQNAVDFTELTGNIADPAYYAAMMENSNATIRYLTEARAGMQAEFDQAVKNGELVYGSNEWYEQLAKMYEVDAEIDEATASLEEFQNSINDIYWQGFEELINRFDYLSEESQSLIDLMSDLDMVSMPDNEDGWTADDVKWTNEGLASLGLHAQEMVRAEEKSKEYAKAIEDLKNEYEAGHYSESEYYEKLNELTQGQYDAIQAAKDEKKAIVELNQQRVDGIKKGIEKEVDAYEKLINAKKEALDAEKDLHDWQKTTTEQQKTIADIERKLAALASDNSLSAIAKRKQLEAELAQAQYELEETYYDRSVTNKKDALDKELEDFKTEKDAEKEKWDKYLEDVELVVANSLGLVQTNSKAVYDTLKTQAEEYGIKISDEILNPWNATSGAIDTYTTKFGDAANTTVESLDAIRAKWEEVRKMMALANAEADKYYKPKDYKAPTVDDINKENKEYYEEQEKFVNTPKPEPEPKPEPAPQPKPDPKPAGPSLAKGSSVTVKKSATNFGSRSNNARMKSYVPGGTYTVYQVSGDQILIGRNGAYTGWVNKSDIEGFAKGTTSLGKSGIVNIDELGEELVLGAHNGRLTYMEKGSGIIPADITSNLMSWGMLDPQDILDRNRPSIAPAKNIVNTEIHVDNSVGELIHIEHCDQNTLPDVEKMVNKAFDKHIQTLNNSLKRFTR